MARFKGGVVCIIPLKEFDVTIKYIDPNKPVVPADRERRYAKYRAKMPGYAWHGTAQEAMPHLGEEITHEEAEEFGHELPHTH